jgi:hypothetical protein
MSANLTLRIANGSAATLQRFAAKDWAILSVLVIFAATLRLLFINGPLGSDDIVYLNRSLQIAEGSWTTAQYNGSLRYGLQHPGSAVPARIRSRRRRGQRLAALLLARRDCGDIRVCAQGVEPCRRLVCCDPARGQSLAHRRGDAHSCRIRCWRVSLRFRSCCSMQRNNIEMRACTRSQVSPWAPCSGGRSWPSQRCSRCSYPLVIRRVDVRWLWVVAGGLVMLVGHLALMQLIASDPCTSSRW